MILEAVDRRAVVEGGQEGDAPVSEVDEVADRQFGRYRQIGVDTRQRRGLDPGIDEGLTRRVWRLSGDKRIDGPTGNSPFADDLSGVTRPSTSTAA